MAIWINPKKPKKRKGPPSAPTPRMKSKTKKKAKGY
jgi:hypothetical protein